MANLSETKISTANKTTPLILMQYIAKKRIQIQSIAASVIHRLLAYGWNCCHALMQGVWLPPLPVYWDSLAKREWQIWQEDDFQLASVFRQEVLKQFRLRVIASYSIEHENLYWDFVKYGEGERKPLRPYWFRQYPEACRGR